MRFNCGPTPEEKWDQRIRAANRLWERVREWHTVFAWFPVRIGSGDCRWLERVERRLPPGTARIDWAYGEFEWQYRPLQEVHTFKPG